MNLEPAKPCNRQPETPAADESEGSAAAMIFFGGPRCALCTEVLGDRPYLRTGGRSDVFPSDQMLAKFSYAPMHWDCYEDWPERLTFARACVSSAAAAMSHDEHVGLALHDERVCVGVSRHGVVTIWLTETGTCLFVPLSDWTVWLSDPTLGQDDCHRVEIVSLGKALPELRRLFPTTDTLVASVDWEAKARLEEERIRSWQADRDALRAHNEACLQFFRLHGPHGLTCPYCSRRSGDIEFVDRAPYNGSSCFVCPACARSFGHDL